ncbi:histidine kinase [Nocardiopsis sp. RSe5-2]|uniref:histidine kinase n=1 Tax=Nocardiopsis endophytica TaxID=3018445 RepID=A0ABT4TYK2_9ACTN|nr:histidine kinase [Nocardiopsis endophytica]MDA2809773.1 histidine kinase [Nocardiopsis endophytica]
MSAGRPGAARAAVDGAIAVGMAAALVAAALAEQRPQGGAGLLAVGLAAASGLVLAGRRRAPAPVLAATAALAAGYQAAGLDLPAAAFLVALYTAVRAGRRAAAAAWALGLLVALPLAAVAAGAPAAGQALAQARGALEVAWLVAAAAAGEALRQAEARAEQAERTREEAARRRADEERLHIARELHDSLTHQISVIKLQAEVALHLAGRRGEPVPEPVLAIAQAGREANRELRATLEALRGGAGARPRGLADLPELVRGARAGGLEAELEVEAPAEGAGLPAAVEGAVYRIVQEALTNTVRHAGAQRVRVAVERGERAVRVRVEDDGRAVPGGGAVPGVGLAGMRERVEALGGRLDAGPGPRGGFGVRAELPVEPLEEGRP